MNVRATFRVVLFFVLVTGTGCTKSLEMTYNPAAYPLPQGAQLRSTALGIAKFEDRRSLIDRTEPQSLSYVMLAGQWKFGLTFKGQEYAPVQDFVQDIFVDEFKRAGLLEVRAVPQVLTKDSLDALRAAGEQQRLAYVLGGRLHVFEIVNEVGFWTVTSRRAATLEVTLVQVSNGNVLLDTTVSQLQRENEGMGVMHSTNVDRLMNTIFRQVVTQVIEQVAAKLALDSRDVRVRLAIGPR